METLSDLRDAVRTLARHPGSTMIALTTLALGLGANTLVVSILSTVLFAPLPYPESGRLVVLWQEAPIPGYEELPLSGPDYLDLRQLDVFESLAVFEYRDVTQTGVERPRELKAVAASPDLFAVLRAEAELGRLFAPTAAGAGAERVVVLGHGYWRRELGGETDVVGRRLILNGRAHTVVGVMPSAFHFPFPVTWQGRTYQRPATDVFLPLTLSARADRGDHSLMSVGRLAGGVSIHEAGERLAPAMEKLAAAHPNVHPPGLTARVLEASAQASAAARPALFVLFVAVVLLLLVACANVANLLLARATQRAKEISIRAALGASRGRLLRQLMSESLVLGLGGAAVGVLLAAWSVEVLSGVSIDEIPRLGEARIDLVALGWCVALALGTALVFGLVPALYAVRPDLVRALKALGHGLSAGPLEGRLLKAVVVAELVLTVALLTVAGWAIRGYFELSRADPGFDLERVTALELPLNGEAYAEPAACRYSVTEVLASLSDLPGVEAAGVGSYVPLLGQESAGPFTVAGAPARPGELRLATLRQVSPGFLEALGVRVLAGRGFQRGDDPAAPRVVLVNRALAERSWPGLDPVGQRLTVEDPSSPDAEWWSVAGVVTDVRGRRLDRAAEPTIYFPFAQSVSRRLTLLVRSDTGLAELVHDIEEAVWSVDPGLPVRLRSLHGVVDGVLARHRMSALLLCVFAGVALLLSACGIYGVMAFMAGQRRHEMALRLALGATREQLVALSIRQAAVLAALGAGGGLLAALAFGRLLQGVVYGFGALDPVVLLGIPALFFAMAMAVSLRPAEQAARLDAVEPLRAE